MSSTTTSMDGSSTRPGRVGGEQVDGDVGIPPAAPGRSTAMPPTSSRAPLWTARSAARSRSDADQGGSRRSRTRARRCARLRPDGGAQVTRSRYRLPGPG